MTQAGSPDQRTEIAPPAEPRSKWQRTGYVLLAAGGLVVSTAFGAVAQITDPADTADTSVPAGQVQQVNGQAPGSQQIPGNPVPGGPVVVGGVPQAGPTSAASSSAAPTTVVSVGPDGQTTTNVIPPPANPPNNPPPNNPPNSPSDPGSQLPPSNNPTGPPSTPPTDPTGPTSPTDPTGQPTSPSDPGTGTGTP